ncbi:bacterial Ig-like domain protein [Methanobrevibacter cuticularis]|uniref:Bacterial Ig-like domain protein n=1 Tax=Methanobrevibacter cuticularis TaxID=47311 RepID=A0A166CQJ3_9EURY|nr:Ig-like domain repeat protein [Methanobrevibacter cuticularis]KZX14765.1 bacterial Ig-like domain protein [Methanobrevibacter cuticularis]
MNYNAFLNQSTSTIHKASASSAVVDADYNYWGFNGLPSLGNVVVNNYYVLNITNTTDLSGNYAVGDLLRFNYTVYLNGTSDSSGSDLLPSLNGVYWNGTFFKEFGLSNNGIIEVPIQTIADPNVVFKNLNGTIIGSGIFTLTGSISKGNITNITVDQLTIVNNSVADITLHINPNIGGLSPITFEVTINGQKKNVTFVNGTGIFNDYDYGLLGNQNLSISFASTDDYNPASTNLSTSFKDNVNLDVTADDVTYGDDVTVVINATTPNGTAILDGIYEVIINNITYNVTFTNGIGRVNIPGLDVDEYTYTILFKESSNYTESDDNVNFIVSKSGTIVNVDLPSDAVYGENSTIAGNIADANGNLINGTYNITVTVNGVDYNVTVIDGLWSLTIPNTIVGLNTITVTYSGDSNYENSDLNIDFNVTKANATININLPNNATYGGNSTISGTITDANGNLVNGNYTITIIVNGTSYDVNVVNGLWNLTLPNNNAGNVTVEAIFENNNYNKTTTNGTYLIKPANKNTTITITSTRNGNKITYKITLKDNQGNILANQNLSLTIAGKTVNLRTNSQGIAQYTYTATKAGKYYANATYNGLNTENIIYDSSSAKSNTISITKTSIKIYLIKVSAKTVKYHGKRYRVYYKTYYIKNYGILTGSKLFQKSLKGFTLSKISKTSNIKTNYNKTKKILKTSVKNLAHAKIAKIKIKFYKRIT